MRSLTDVYNRIYYVQDEGGFPGRLLGFAHQRAGSQEGQGKLSTACQPLKWKE